MVDRALAVHALLAAGRSPADVQRRLGKSKGYVSVLGYLGQALAGVEPEDLAGLRTPAVTPRAVWPLVTRARTDERAALQAALAGAVTGADRDLARRRARARATVQLRAALRAHAQAVTAGLLAPPRPRGGRRPRHTAGATVVAFDPAAWAEDPIAYARTHFEALAAAHGHVAERATRAVALAGAEHALTGQVAAAGEASLHRIGGARWRALAAAARSARTPAEERALAALAVLTRKLREAHDEVARLATVTRPTATASGSVAVAGRPDYGDEVPWEEVERDLHD